MKSKNDYDNSWKIKLQIFGKWIFFSRYLINNKKNFLFRFAFPFGRPEGALKATLSLLERVLTKDAATPISREDIRYFIRKCLENAAYTNYTRVSDQAKIEGNSFLISSLEWSVIKTNIQFRFFRRTRDPTTEW